MALLGAAAANEIGLISTSSASTRLKDVGNSFGVLFALLLAAISMEKSPLLMAFICVVQTPLNEVLPSTHLPRDVKYLGKRIFEIELKGIKDTVRILLNEKKNYLTNQSQLLEPFEIVYKHEFDYLVGQLQGLKKTGAELNNINGACDIYK
ncbi:hypothetical protein P8452_63867 [Trifolium repens]|nr:hypothetical protein P8452_63867 [Trifolium repens]